MPRVSRDKDGLAEARAAVSIRPQFAALAPGWLWTLLVIVMIGAGGTSIAYPMMRTLSGLCGAMALAAAVTSRSSRWTRPGPADWIVAGMVILFLVQLIPLPPAIWTRLPGHALIAAIDREVFGQPLWRSLSIDSEATWQSFAFLIPFLGSYLAYRSGSTQRRAALMRGVAIGFAIAVAMGLLQAAGLDGLHPYPIEADNQYGNGFFTNHNHQATFVLMAGLLLASHPAMPGKGLLDARVMGLALSAGLATLASGSRAGFALLMLTALAFGAAWFVTRERPAGSVASSRRPLILALGGSGILAAAIAALVISADRFALGRGALLDDPRFEIIPVAWQAIWQFWPFGSGFGTFQTPYWQVEPIEALRILDINHAHNDLIEAAIEGGAFALALILALILRIAVLTGRALRTKGPQAMRTAATGLALMVPLVHSLVDYPLRAMAVAVLFAMALAKLEAETSETFESKAKSSITNA